MANIKSVIEKTLGIFKIPPTQTPQIPSELILTGGSLKPGLSPSRIAARIISRQSDSGAPDDTGGISEAMEKIRVEEIVNAIIEDMRITVVIPPGTPLTAKGASPSGPVVVLGNTIYYTRGYGAAQ